MRSAGGWRGFRMRSSFLGSLTLVLVAFAISAASLAQTAKPSGAAAGIPDLSGTWNRGTGHSTSGIFDDDPGGVPFLGFTKQEPPLQPSAMKTYQTIRNGITDPRLKGRDDVDPSNSCYPPGPTRIFTIPRPIRDSPDSQRGLHSFRDGSLGAPNLRRRSRASRRLPEHVDGTLDWEI